MSNDMVPHQGGALVPADNPVSRTLAVGHAPGMNLGAVAIESERAIAEAQGKMTLAKRFPRSMTAATTEFMDACKSPEFAATAFYSVPNRGSGPSIRFAEEAARCYGNFIYGHRELGRTPPGPGPKDYGASEIEVYAWDVERNNHSTRQITVMHCLDTKNGPRKLTDQADIDNRIANVASKQMRGRILALMPKGMIAAGIEECKRTLAGDNEKPLSDRLINMAAAFGRFGVTDAHLTAYLGHPVDSTTLDELGDLMGIYNAIRDGAKTSDYFQLGDAPDDGKQPAPAAAAITQQVQQSNEQQKPAATRTTRSRSSTNGKPAESDAQQKKDSQSESPHKQEAQPTDTPPPPAGAQPSSTGASPTPSTPPVDDDPF
ncbi:hypothetical protein [Bordetella phage vB_BbrM_PHB04]|uniref:Uncharacterized protein n=1 Tax=Bordetella phage vB_BbrM_PHB04 TaxID=2029657 RepID=A0A291LAT4_9CAUD|nr:hypothetical protein HOS14_gp108 [Bordetella phage vB_BbrM_PHB04]ATI15726.1 hypothetical protein [Bordetella phage vB_BbrM_PHB04]